MKLGINWFKWWESFERQFFHIVFIFSLVALSLLVAWWSFFIYRSVNDDYQNRVIGVQQSVLSYTLFLGHNALELPKVGVYYLDHRLEVVTSVLPPTFGARELLPFWEGYWLQPRVDLLRQWAEKHQRRLLMIVGESCLVVLLILISGFMIYRMYWLERRSTRELHELWSRVSHEIKTPITGVRAFLETLRAGHFNEEEMRPLLDMALQQVERQQQLAENMLVGQKLHRRGLGVQVIDLQIIPFLRVYIERHPLSVKPGVLRMGLLVEENSSLVEVRVDPEVLRVILDNLIDNAVKYSGRRESELVIELGVELVSSVVRVVVSDNGVGFEGGMSERIFRAYQRLGNELPGNQHGTGMGLYISRRLARKMGGDLTASSSIGKGAEFVLTLRGVKEPS